MQAKIIIGTKFFAASSNQEVLSCEKPYITAGVSPAKFTRSLRYYFSMLQSFKVWSKVDNVDIDAKTGDLWIGTHPNMFVILQHMGDPKIPSPSQVSTSRALWATDRPKKQELVEKVVLKLLFSFLKGCSYNGQKLMSFGRMYLYFLSSYPYSWCVSFTACSQNAFKWWKIAKFRRRIDSDQISRVIVSSVIRYDFYTLYTEGDSS